jgi:hypothetical protein
MKVRKLSFTRKGEENETLFEDDSSDNDLFDTHRKDSN